MESCRNEVHVPKIELQEQSETHRGEFREQLDAGSLLPCRGLVCGAHCITCTISSYTWDLQRLMKIFGQVFLVMRATPLTEVPSLWSLTKPTPSLHIGHLENKSDLSSCSPICQSELIVEILALRNTKAGFQKGSCFKELKQNCLILMLLLRDYVSSKAVALTMSL